MLSINLIFLLLNFVDTFLPDNMCNLHHTVEPLNKGHFGGSLFVLYTEVVLCSEAK